MTSIPTSVTINGVKYIRFEDSHQQKGCGDCAFDADTALCNNFRLGTRCVVNEGNGRTDYFWMTEVNAVLYRMGVLDEPST